jgi:pimeloyl-ACP methyl ester carboxylesterase
MVSPQDRQEGLVEVETDVQLWVETAGDPDAPPMLLIMGANASGLAWPDDLVARLAARHRVLRYDHRDTGRSTARFAERPYPISTLAHDALAVLDAHGIDRSHVVGMSLGGTLVQLLMLDAPERLLSATLLGTSALEAHPPAEDAADLPGPSGEIMAMWQHLADRRDRDADIAWHVEHWQALAGAAEGGAFDADEVRALEERIRRHSGRDQQPTAHALADQSGLSRGAELPLVRVPTLVIEAPLDPVVPPPHARHLAAQIPGARLVTIPTMGHALPRTVLEPVADAILSLTNGSCSEVDIGP